MSKAFPSESVHPEFEPTVKECPKCGNMSLRTNGSTPTGKPRWRCKPHGKHCYGTTNPDAPYRGQNGAPKKKKRVKPMPKFHRGLGGTTGFFVTCAQNATPIHEGFFNTALAFCSDRNAEFLPVPILYKNPTSVWTESQENAHIWDPRIQPYLYNQRKKLTKNLILMGDISTQPTTVNPLTGFESHTHGESGIIAHPKLHMKTVASPMGKYPKIFTTTGAITLRNNYTRTPTGKRGSFHHSFGAIYVEIADGGKRFHIHQINPRDDGAFIFKDKAYYPDGTVEAAPPSKALIFGDAHYRWADPTVVEATFGTGGLVETLDAQELIFHDLFDGYAGSPHHAGNPFINAAKIKHGFHLMRDEVEDTIAGVIDWANGRESRIVFSNHDEMFNRWIIREDWKKMAEAAPDNAEFYLETALEMLRSAKLGDHGAEYLDPFQYWVERLKGDAKNIRCLDPRKSYEVAGVELSLHGDKGPNGARGTIKNLRRSGVKIISGHGHSPGIDEDHWRVGTMTRLIAEYTYGLGGWLNTHGSIDGFGKRHLHTCIDAAFWA